MKLGIKAQTLGDTRVKLGALAREYSYISRMSLLLKYPFQEIYFVL